MNRFKLPVLVSAAAIGVTSAPALASGGGSINYSALTSAIDVTSTVQAILSVGAVMVGVALAVMGVRKIISMARGG